MKDSNEKEDKLTKHDLKLLWMALLTHPKYIVHSPYNMSQSASETADLIHNKKKKNWLNNHQSHIIDQHKRDLTWVLKKDKHQGETNEVWQENQHMLRAWECHQQS